MWAWIAADVRLDNSVVERNEAYQADWCQFNNYYFKGFNDLIQVSSSLTKQNSFDINLRPI